jgi:putative ABC transport system permease protein
MAWAAISSNKMRSFLTVLGVIIGIIAVVVLTSLGQSAMDQVTGQIQDLGTNMLVVSVNTTRRTDITTDLLHALVGRDGISAVSPQASGRMTAKAGTESFACSVEGVEPAFFAIRKLSVAQGRALNAADEENRSPVAVIGVEVADKLFGNRNVLGNTLSVAGHELTIVGLLEEQGTSMMGSEDARIMLPFALAQRVLKQKDIGVFFVSTESEAVIPQAEQSLHRFMQARTTDAEDYDLLNQSSILDLFDQFTSTFTMLLSGIAGIALLVGGISIMNIMLVSVTERTREIGIRKAIGAQRSAILMQFLIEAVVLSLSGGLLGVLVSWLILTGLRGPLAMPQLSVSLGSLQLALSFSTAIGVLFGIYPANKASLLKPIDALRYE